MPQTNISRPDQPEAATFLARVQAALELLESIASDRGLLLQIAPAERQRLLQAAGHVYAPDAAARRQLVRASSRRRKAEKIEQENRVLNRTGIRTLRRGTVYTSPNVFPPEAFQQGEVDDPGFREAVEPQHCYVCKQKYTSVHHFYDQMCPPCAGYNFTKRTELADLRGRVALLTGGRIKIGYQAGLKLLRAGAHLIVTTRFPRDSAVRYSSEPDFKEWGHRLEIFGLDLRHTPSVEAFCRELLGTRDHLDFIVNNACQTVRRPPEFYEHMMASETAALHAMP
ncbi:MAG TPA: oxidoreductase, partial [Gemmatimonadales bacterium]|nr:oxidoreductase [Gemmatimonadales bacterium]